MEASQSTSEAARPPSIERFLDDPTYELDDWSWLWRGNHEFPLRSHRPGFAGRLVVWLKRLARPLVKSPQSDLWDRQRVWNVVLISHLREIYKLRDHYDRLGSDLQAVQREILDDLRAFQADYLRDTADLAERVEHLEEYKRDGLADVMRHNDALFARVDQKIDRLKRQARELEGRLASSRD